MRRVFAGVVVVLLALVVPPARAQPVDSPWLSPQEAEPRESDGEVVLTLSKNTPGRIMYRTVDGSCTHPFTGLERRPCSPPARAPEDYGAVSGEVVFTGAGSKKITIAIVDDDLAEGMEDFQVEAHEVTDTSGWAGGSVAIVSIIDESGAAGQPAATTTTAAGSQSSSSAPVLTVPPTPSPLGDVPVPDLTVELASPMLEPGPGFELTSEGRLEPPPARGGGGGGSASSWLAPALGTAAAGVVAVAFLRRRKQWSPTRP